MIPFKPERKAQLEEDLEWERLDYNETVEAVQQAYEDVKAGRTRPSAEFLEELCAKLNS